MPHVPFESLSAYDSSGTITRGLGREDEHGGSTQVPVKQLKREGKDEEEEDKKTVKDGSELDWNVSRRQAEVTGELNVKTVDGRQLVISEGWPSWVIALQSSGCQNVRVIVDKTSQLHWNHSDLEIGSRILKCKLELLESGLVLDFFSSSNQFQGIWLQGSQKFVKRIIESLNESDAVYDSLSFLLPGRSRSREKFTPHGKRVAWTRLCHADLGGITESKWEFGSTATYNTSDLSKGLIRRVLGDVLDCTEKGISCAESFLKIKSKLGRAPHSDVVCLDKQSLVPFGLDRVEVVAPSVFSASKFCRRYVTPIEMGHVYDLPELTIKALKEEEALTPVKSEFVRAAPIKVVKALSDVVIRSWFQPHSVASDKISDDEPSSGRNSVALLVYDDEPQNTSTPKQDTPSFAKAVKNDDAKAHVDMWDEAAVQEFDVQDHVEFLLALPKVSQMTSRMGNVLVTNANGEVTNDHRRLFDILRRWMMKRYRLNLMSSFKRYLRNRYGEDVMELWMNRKTMMRNANADTRMKFGKGQRLSTSWWKELVRDMEAGSDAITRAVSSTWWDWSSGSTLLFWRWPKTQQREIRDGLKAWVRFDKLPNYWARQQLPSDQRQREQLIKKVGKVAGDSRDYVSKGLVKSLTGYFAVPKGLDDIRVVYDATKCGLNDALWAPNFWLPTIDTILRNADLDAWFGDIDLGEMFLNYPLDPNIRPYAGVDVTACHHPNLSDSQLSKVPRVVHRWERCAMGLTPSPILCTKAFAWSEEMIKGMRTSPQNPLGWDKVILNLPGMLTYNPSLPWVYRIQSSSGRLAGYFGTYVDDIRPAGNTKKHCRQIARRVASMANYLGEQDAARKRRPISQTPGAWAGALVVAREGNLYVTTSQEKWDKCKQFLMRWKKELESPEGSPLLDHKDLQKGRGHLVYLCRTFPSATPFLKGIHHTLESWRPGRNEDGWKFDSSRWKSLLMGIHSDLENDVSWIELKKRYVEKHGSDAPRQVRPVKRLKEDISTLLFLMRSSSPPLRLVRGSILTRVRYGFGDAAGSGFGAVWQSASGLRYRYGVWGDDMLDSSSNYRELTNLVESLELMSRENSLDGMEIFFFTDNSTAERAFFKGNSSSEKLHALVTRLRDLEMNGGCVIRLCHVSGKRMIAQGADGLSRGNLTEGVMSHGDIMLDIPLHISALDRSIHVKAWIESWVELSQKEVIEFLEPIGWFERGHDMIGDGSTNIDGLWIPQHKKGIFVWAPAPAAAEVALEEIRKARHKRQASTHIFVCPRLFEPYWRGHLFKAADLVFEVPIGVSFWPHSCYEPLVVGIFFPFLRVEPWQLKGSSTMLGVAKQLRKLWKESEVTAGLVLRKLWSFTRELENLPKGVVRSMLHSTTQFEVSREPAHE